LQSWRFLDNILGASIVLGGYPKELGDPLRDGRTSLPFRNRCEPLLNAHTRSWQSCWIEGRTSLPSLPFVGPPRPSPPSYAPPGHLLEDNRGVKKIPPPGKFIKIPSSLHPKSYTMLSLQCLGALGPWDLRAF